MIKDSHLIALLNCSQWNQFLYWHAGLIELINYIQVFIITGIQFFFLLNNFLMNLDQFSKMLNLMKYLLVKYVGKVNILID